MPRLYFKDENFIEPEETIYYLLAQDGLYQVKRNPSFRSALKVNGTPQLLEHQEEVQFLLPKVPALLMEEIIAFFRRVYGRLGSEAVVLLYYSTDTGQYQAKAPLQHVSDSECEYEIGATPSGWQLVGTVHSHCKGPAYHSADDDEDEGEMDGLHITIGDLNGELSFSCSLVVDYRRVLLDSEEVMEGYPKLGHQRKGFQLVDQWMRSVKLRAGAMDDAVVESGVGGLYSVDGLLGALPGMF